MLKNTYKLN